MDAPTADRLTLAQAAHLCPGKPSPAAIWRWAREGIKTRSGERVRLDHERIGRKIFTTREALSTFFKRVTESDLAKFDKPTRPETGTSPRSTGTNSKHAAMVAALQRDGLL